MKLKVLDPCIGSAARAGTKVLERELDEVGDTRSLGELSKVVEVVSIALLAISTAVVSSCRDSCRPNLLVLIPRMTDQECESSTF